MVKVTQNNDNKEEPLSTKAKIFWGIVIAVIVFGIFLNLATPNKPSTPLSEYEKQKAGNMGKTDFYLKNNK